MVDLSKIGRRGEGLRIARTLCSLSLAACLVSFAGHGVVAEDILEPVGEIRIRGEVYEGEDVSGIGFLGPHLVLGTDEGHRIQLAKATNEANVYEASSDLIDLPKPGDGEVDIEGIAVHGGTVFVVGSHSLKRKKIKPKKKHAKNRERLETVEAEPTRDALYRLNLNPVSGAPQGPIEKVSLRKVLSQDKVLARFCSIPSKENGIDIEGIAVDANSQLYIGFRGPVLRGNFVPLMVFPFSDPNSYEIRYVNLGGLGIRDLVSVDGGFLILAGPVGDGPGGYKLYGWNGQDMVPGEDREVEPLRILGEVPTPDGGKAEALTVVKETAAAYTVVVAYDGPETGQPAIFRIPKPIDGNASIGPRLTGRLTR